MSDDDAAIRDWILKISVCTATTTPSLADVVSSPASEDDSTASRKRRTYRADWDGRETPSPRRPRIFRAEDRESECAAIEYSGEIVKEQHPDFGGESVEMVPEAASAASATGSILSNRPTLSPVPPSRRSSRSGSPARTSIMSLRFATPPVYICQPGPSARAQPSEAVARLKEYLLDGYDKAFIPKEFEARLSLVVLCLMLTLTRQSRLRAVMGVEAVVLHEAMFYARHGYTAEELEARWKSVEEIYNDASACANGLQDENAWVEIVRSVLGSVGISKSHRNLKPSSVQSQTIEPEYLPRLGASSAFSKKVDLALLVLLDTEIDQWQARNPSTGLSHMSDAYTRESLLVCPFEVKMDGGDSTEAAYQLAVWSAAALEKLKTLAMTRDTEPLAELLPYPGWTVIGYEWQLHISHKENSGGVNVFGNHGLLSVKINSHLNIFRLQRLLLGLEKWFLNEFVSWIRSHVLGSG